VRRRDINGVDLFRAAVVNDVIADEHGMDYDAGQHLGRELGIDVEDLMDFSVAHATKKVPGRKIPGEDARLAVTMAFAAGVMSTLRAVKLLEQEAFEEDAKAA
jgi:hypothetical protein